jgi:dolichol-phosphate mannosyltransferase
MNKSSFFLSVVVPTYNEEHNVRLLYEKILDVIKIYNFEIIFVDDGSTDNTLHEIKQLTKQDNRVKMLSFYRNFGHQMALTCGYEHAKGDCVITLDADLQDPPAIIHEMIEEWQKGSKIVYAQRKTRNADNFLKKITADMFYTFINFLSDNPIPREVGDFRLLDKEVVQYLNALPEKSRFLRGLVAWGGFPASFVYFDRERRHAGKTHYTLGKMLNFALEGITSFSTKPLRLASLIGFFSAIIGFFGIIYAIITRIYIPGFSVTGWTLLFVGIMFFGGVQLITIGIIGEYIAKIYKEVQNRPQYLIKEKVNI